MVRSYIKIDKNVQANWLKLGDIKKADLLTFIAKEKVDTYNLDYFTIWVVSCQKNDHWQLDKNIGFVSYDTQTREQKEQIEIYFDW